MVDSVEYRQQIIAEYKEVVLPLFKYLPWMEQYSGKSVTTIYDGQEIGAETLRFPVYDGTLMNFVREASRTKLMDKNYIYVFTRNKLVTTEDVLERIQKSDWQQWDVLRGILSKYVLGGQTKGMLWNEAMREGIFYQVLKRMKEIIEFWDKPLGR